MRRRSHYEVDLKRVFTNEQWLKLDAAFNRHPRRNNYKVSPIGIVPESTYFIAKRGDGYFTKDEINELYWFFQGAMCALGGF